MTTGLNNRLTWAEHAVYRLYDQQDRLIYVGCTARLSDRLKHHAKTMWWWEQVARVDIESHPNRTVGLAAEKFIRDTEHPRWNIEARWMYRQHWTNQMFEDYITALKNHPSNKNIKWDTKINKARQLQQIRYGTNQQQAA